MPGVIFLALSAITIISAIIALEARELVYGAIALGIMFLGVAGFFIRLGAPYLAIFQIAIYIGAIVVLVLFTIMLVRREAPEELREEEVGLWSKFGHWIPGFIALALAGVALLVSGANIPPSTTPSIPLENLGKSLVLNYGVALLILAVIMSAAIIGALTLARVERGDG